MDLNKLSHTQLMDLVYLKAKGIHNHIHNLRKLLTELWFEHKNENGCRQGKECDLCRKIREEL